MIKYSTKKYYIKHEIVWFSDYIPSLSLFYFADYRQCSFSYKRFGFKRQINTSIIVNLDNTLDEIFSNFSANTRNEIRRACRNNYIYLKIEDLNTFIDFYNIFSENRARDKINIDNFRHFKNNIYISAITSHTGEYLVMHSYIIDSSSGNVRLLHSASHFREISDKSHRAAIGVANRYLHFKDIEYFKNNFFKKYDFGGISKTQKIEDVNIAKFKNNFGGTEFLCTDYISYSLWFALKLKLIFRIFYFK
jgi:lipid II:glycine glycyltransferase (peptidoglycan interpeptide bridge formation enzyme)